MTLAMHFSCRFFGVKALRIVALWVLFLLSLSIGPSLMADATNAVPVNPAAPAKEDFGQYLVDHGADLAPFFDKHAEDLIRKAMPMLLSLLAWISMFAVIAVWVVDIFLARGFTPFFAPAYTKLPRAIFYATGRLILNLVVLGLFALTVWLSSNYLHAGIIILGVALLLAVVTVVVQVGWLTYVFRMNIGGAMIFYVIILGAQILTFFLVAAPILAGKPSAIVYRFVNETMTPELQGEVDETNRDLADVNKATDASRAKLADLNAKLVSDQAETDRLNAEIEEKKNSEAFRFQEIVRVEAQGDLAAAHDQFTSLLAKYPNGALADSVKTHLAQVDAGLAAQAAQKKQAEADAAAAAAAARADLLAKAGRGEATLSEMRQALVGKSQADVTGLLGQPTDTKANAWGYGQQMMVNPMTKEKHGLAVYFVEGTVQSVDYYYGEKKQ